MTRSVNLDTIAPDDPVISPLKITSKPKKTASKTSPHVKKTSSPPSPKSNKSTDNPYRQKVYQLLKDKTKHSFSSLLARPKVFTFESRDADEEILLVLRRHWFTNLSWIITFFVLIFAPILLSKVPFLDFFNSSFRFILILFWYLVSFAFAFEKFLSWYFNVFILTEERVIDIDFDNLLYKNISEAQISMIQDVTVTQGGVSQTLFNYGSVYIQTASEVPQIEVLKVPNPNLVLKVLQQMRSEEELETLEGRLE